jgi:hypothetical protein
LYWSPSTVSVGEYRVDTKPADEFLFGNLLGMRKFEEEE